jgi:hypothetical protein
MEFIDLALELGTFVLLALSIYQVIPLFRRQTDVDVFLSYTQRYNEIMSLWPKKTWGYRFDQDLIPEEDDEATLAVLQYLNLCSEEYHPFSRGLLSREVWGIWEGEIIRTLASQLMRREWSKLRDEYSSFPAFMAFVERVQSGLEQVSH